MAAIQPANRMWLISYTRRQCIIYGPYTQEEAIALSQVQMPVFSPARGTQPIEVHEVDSPTLIWRNTD